MHAPAHISTVTTPASSYQLVDIVPLKTRLNVTGTTNDDFFTQAIADATAAAVAFTKNPIVVETLTDRIWPFRDRRLGAVRTELEALQLKRWPIVSVTSVTETIAGVATTLQADVDYLVQPDDGQIVRLDRVGAPRTWGANPVVVVYVAGFDPVPSDVQEAISDMVKARYFARTRDPAIRSENVEGIQATQYWIGAGPGADGDLPPAIQAKLARYRPKTFA